jgi:hypothetical protein
MCRWPVTVLLTLRLLDHAAHAEAQAVDHNAESPSRDLTDPLRKPRWQNAVGGSLRLLVIEHTTRAVFQGKTRRELGGPFFPDYARSVRWPTGWHDGDGWKVNYIGHPIHGAAAGFVWLESRSEDEMPPAFSKAFWASRGRAAIWAAAYSLQFELGPLSEASIGNVGLHPGTTGWVDHVITPAGALGFMVIEDWIDRCVILRIESWTGNRVIRAIARVTLNPSRSFAIATQGQMPWFRPGRALR